jgi:hypothetical protein
MTADLEQDLRAAFERSSESVTVRGDLVQRVLRAHRRRRRILAGTMAGTAILAAIAVLIAVSGTFTRPAPGPAGHGKRHGAARSFTLPGGAGLMAATPSMLYFTTINTGNVLDAVSLRTGRLVRQVPIPANPSALAIGPGGYLWVSFYPDQNGGGTGVWRLSPDLRQHYGLNLASRSSTILAPFDVLPVSADTAVLATGRLATIRISRAGAAFRPGPAVPRFGGTMAATGLARVGGRLAVRFESDGGDWRIWLPGPPSRIFAPPGRFNPYKSPDLGSFAGQAGGLWIIKIGANNTGSPILLNSRLQVITPRSIARNPLLASAYQLYTTGSTVWVEFWSNQIACFRYAGGHAGPVQVIRGVTAEGALAVAGHTVYLAGQTGITGRPVPRSCR